MCNQNNDSTNTNNCQCLNEILQVILQLQRGGEQNNEQPGGCDKPFLGPCPSVVCFNTRPINFYSCSNATLWTLPYTLNGTTGTSSVFRVENLDGCCCTCRILAPNPDTTQTASPYVATESYCTFNLNCVGALKCLADTFVPCI